MLFMAYDIGFQWFYAMEVQPHRAVVVSHLWPRGKVSIPIHRIAEIRVFKMTDRSGKTPSPYVQIVLTSGKRIGSTSPLPPPDEIEREITSLPARRITSPARSQWTVYQPSADH